jgi:hypothetical protein
MVQWPPPVYRMRATFNAPLAFVYRWCIDYRSDDARRAGEHYERRVIERSSRRVVVEDLWWEPDGWRWRRSEVTPRPPDRWTVHSFGNVRDAHIEYRLTELPGDRTQLDIVMLRRPGVRQKRQPSKRKFEREVNGMWRNLSRSLDSDYRIVGARARRRPRRQRTAA